MQTPVPDANYFMEYSDDINQPNWTDLRGTGALVTLPVPMSRTGCRFYKVRIE